MSGEYDYLLRVVLVDTADFERLHSQHPHTLAARRARAVELRACEPS